MALGIILSLCFAALTFVLSLIFKIAGKLRLTLPLLYLLAAVVSTFFTDWTSQHEDLGLLSHSASALAILRRCPATIS